MELDHNQDSGESSSEWEYEYDENETEDFYFTIDLTTHVPHAARRQETTEQSQGQENGANSASSNGGLAPAQAAKAVTSTDSVESDLADRVQILDLHSDNPIILYENKPYSCHWASAIGTDMLFRGAEDEATSNSPTPAYTPLRSTPDYTLLATTPMRLVAKPITYSARPINFGGSATSNNLSPVVAEPFLHRLSALKAARGHRDSVPFRYRSRRLPGRGSVNAELSSGRNLFAVDPDDEVETIATVEADSNAGVEENVENMATTTAKQRKVGRPRGKKSQTVDAEKTPRRRRASGGRGRGARPGQIAETDVVLPTPETWASLPGTGANGGETASRSGLERRSDDGSDQAQAGAEERYRNSQMDEEGDIDMG